MSGTPRSLAVFRWSPARMPRPPEYCGSTEVMPYSGEKYAIACGASRTGLLLEPAGAGEVLLEVGVRQLQHPHEALVRRQLLQPGARDSPQRLDGITTARAPDLGVDGGEDVLRLRVPGPTQVGRQVAQQAQGLGQDGADGESSDGSHGRTLTAGLLERSNEVPGSDRPVYAGSGHSVTADPTRFPAWGACRRPRDDPFARTAGLRKCVEHGRTHPRHGRDTCRQPRAPPREGGRRRALRRDRTGLPGGSRPARRRGRPHRPRGQESPPGTHARRRGPGLADGRDGLPRRRGRVVLRGPVVERPHRHLAARRRHQDPCGCGRRADVHRGRPAARARGERRPGPGGEADRQGRGQGARGQEASGRGSARCGRVGGDGSDLRGAPAA